MSYQKRAIQIQERLDELGGISDLPDILYRPYGGAAMRETNRLVAQWMMAAGMAPTIDAIGNLRGRKKGLESNGCVFLLGSHLDTVPNAGRYDGPLGVLLAIAAVDKLTLPFDVEVIAFCDEEGARFHSTYLGSDALAGNPPNLELRDSTGISLRQAIRAFGGDPDRLDTIPIRGTLLGYLEAHIEQGPTLQHLGRGLGVVSGIAGQNRAMLRLQGEAGHAGTVPMGLRRDAFCGAAEFAVAVEEEAMAISSLVATIGKVDVLPGASNVIPGSVLMTLDVRHALDITREEVWNKLQNTFEQIAIRRSLFPMWETVQTTPAVTCSPQLTARLESSLLAVQGEAPRLVSGAGHDAAALSGICPVSMLFVRCLDGVSHHPDEFVSIDDIALAITAMEHFLRSLAEHEF